MNVSCASAYAITSDSTNATAVMAKNLVRNTSSRASAATSIKASTHAIRGQLARGAIRVVGGLPPRPAIDDARKATP